jgi:hypothetical protein
MRTVMLCAALALAAVAEAKDFVNEGFEGVFPPRDWTTKYEGEGNARWEKVAPGPWGSYALGFVSSSEKGLAQATLMSYEFDLKPNTRVYYRFDYQRDDNGHGVADADFYITIVEGSHGNLTYQKLPLAWEWEVWAGDVVCDRAIRVKGCWRVWTINWWRSHNAYLAVDRVIISDKKRFPAVAPASLGRVKGLFR